MKKLIIPILIILILSGWKSYPKSVSDGDLVYYTPKGKSYHSTKECPSLVRSSLIQAAILNKFKNYPKYDACDNCVKQ